VDFAFMQTTLIDELVNFKEGFLPALIEIRRAPNGGADERGGSVTKGRTPAAECRERLMGKRGEPVEERVERTAPEAGEEAARHGPGSRQHGTGARPTRHAPRKRRY
jgi:hypothetical protein